MIETTISNTEIQAIEYGKIVGKIEFLLSNSVMTILHTYAYENGRGIGSLLMQTAVKWAESNHYTIIPICSFAQHFLASKQL
jgi:predicted GNAT family acetyltransferase